MLYVLYFNCNRYRKRVDILKMSHLSLKDFLNSKSTKVCSMRFRRNSSSALLTVMTGACRQKMRCKQSARSSPMVTWFLLLIIFII